MRKVPYTLPAMRCDEMPSEDAFLETKIAWQTVSLDFKWNNAR